MTNGTLAVAKAPAVRRARRSALLRRVAALALTYLVLTVIALLMLAPFVAMVSQSLKPNLQVLQFPFRWIPESPGLRNYEVLFSQSYMLRWFFNSGLVAVAVTLLHVFTGSLSGYVFARKEFPGRDLIFWAFMSLLLVPGQVMLIPLFIILRTFGLVNTYLALILPSATSIFATFLMRQFIKTLPRDYDDAARIDGASEFGIYWRVILPLVRPALAVLATFTFIGQWNDFLFPLVVMTSIEMNTLSVGLARLQPMGGEAGVTFAAATFSFIPTAAVFLALQKHVIKGIALSGVKG
jgi:multiple sugar transport system permease protein